MLSRPGCKPPSGKAMAEQAGFAFVQSPFIIRVRPKLGELAVTKPGSNTNQGVASGNIVAANASRQSCHPEWNSRTPRLAGHKKFTLARTALEQASQIGIFKVMQEQIGGGHRPRRY